MRDDPIKEYYDRVDRRKREAYRKLREAKERSESREVIAKLEDAANWAGYTGD